MGGKTRNLESREREFIIREIREIRGNTFAEMKDFLLSLYVWTLL
jgi:hypothetical protein